MKKTRPPSIWKFIGSGSATGGALIVSWLAKAPLWVQIVFAVVLCAIVFIYLYYHIRYHNSALKDEKNRQDWEKEMSDLEKWKDIPQREVYENCMKYYQEKNRLEAGCYATDVNFNLGNVADGKAGQTLIEYKPNKNKYKRE